MTITPVRKIVTAYFNGVNARIVRDLQDDRFKLGVIKSKRFYPTFIDSIKYNYEKKLELCFERAHAWANTQVEIINKNEFDGSGAYMTLALTQHEAGALDALAGYGSKSFLECFYKYMGKAYLGPYEKGIISIFNKIRNKIPNMYQKEDKKLIPIGMK